ncbi:MAG: type II toxin-antitoxin system Phd/YefM family antitoxin [Porticoccaceae bacterium]
MLKSLSIMEARNSLTSLPERLVQNSGEADVLEITRRGKPVLAVMPWELYEAVTETLEVLSDPELQAQFRDSLRELKAGETIPWELAKQRLAA